MIRIGLDIGSTTIKYVVLDENGKVIMKDYQRHLACIETKMMECLNVIMKQIGNQTVTLALSGSAAMGVADALKLEFIQEVFATKQAAARYIPECDCIIELGGEDAKILFLGNDLEVRMNGTCAGGTGAFIDQMATLLNVDVSEMNTLAANYKKIYTIASRCGVFAKSDIQPLINQGASKEDLAVSIYQAVVNQTIQGLAQGRRIEGNVAYLGGPLTFSSELRKRFDATLKCKGLCPEHSLYFVSLGAALLAEKPVNLKDIIHQLSTIKKKPVSELPALFQNEDEVKEFQKRHAKEHVHVLHPKKIEGNVVLGIDSGSTTIKMVLINENKEIVYEHYQSNQGNTIEIMLELLKKLYRENPDMHIISSGVTGYGEELIKNAFGCDTGLVETMAHFTASREILPEVDFIIDIGGQDIKCFKIRNGAIDNLFLNEACSSGCGSFLQTFANALGYSIEDFAKLALNSRHPVNLGSRCTVFMNSSVKQVQKDGAAIEDISAGLAISVVKNALYKVIRCASAQDLGKSIITQGGTFYNDAVLRAFEKELGCEVIRPNIAGLMGAYGTALYALEHKKEHSTLLTLEECENFTLKKQNVQCGLCNNHCALSVYNFGNGRKFIGGNRCERPISKKAQRTDLNMYKIKRELLQSYVPLEHAKHGQIGIPLCLNMMELYPFWHVFFTMLHFEVVNSGFVSEKDIQKAQNTIPSDTVCFPAKVVHGAIERLMDKGVKTIFYPCMSYNIKEKDSDNHYNCPVVAYYPEVIEANTPMKDTTLICDFVGLHNRKVFPSKIHAILVKHYPDLTLKEVIKASEYAYAEYDRHLQTIREKGDEIITTAKLNDIPVICLAGRPYHIDPIVNHGIDDLITSYGAAVVGEDSICDKSPELKLDIWNQWTYHSRMYHAAQYVASQENFQLIQLVSFGCGVDAITTDEVKNILEAHDKIYTQLKIDEITNLGAVKIRLRSLFAAAGLEGKAHE